MTTLSILVRICIWVLGVYKPEIVGELIVSIGFSLHIVARLLCCSLYLFDAIVEIHPTDEKMINDFLVVK
jgi:hypothetical protein